MDIVQIGTAIHDYGLVSILVGAIIYLVVQLIITVVKFLLENKKNKQNSSHNLISIKQLKDYHTIFIKIDSLIKVRIPLMDLGGPVRTKIFRNMLIIYFTNFKKAIDDLLDNDITLDNFLFKNKEMIENVLTKSIQEWEEDGIPEAVIKKFQEWNSFRIDYIETTINDIDSSKVIDTAVEKQYMALNSYNGIIYLTFIDAEKTLTKLNGSLTGKLYKGEKIESLH